MADAVYRSLGINNTNRDTRIFGVKQRTSSVAGLVQVAKMVDGHLQYFSLLQFGRALYRCGQGRALVSVCTMIQNKHMHVGRTHTHTCTPERDGITTNSPNANAAIIRLQSAAFAHTQQRNDNTRTSANSQTHTCTQHTHTTCFYIDPYKRHTAC